MKDDETDPVFMEALEWLARMQDDKASVADRARFAEWRAASRGNAEAYERAERLWNRFDIVKPEYQRLRRADALTRRSVLLGGIAVVALAGGYLALRPDLFADLSTGIGERRVFTLADGSAVELGSHSAVSILYTEGERRLVLHRGQGFFTAAADAARPFVVEAAAGTIRALGTRFDVKLTDAEVTVTVTEHSVSVAPAGAAAVTVEEGWQVSYDPKGVGQPRQIDLETVQAWRRDRIVFEDVPLRRVLRELERYRRGRIVLMDDTVGDIPVTAIFETARADDALRVIAETLPIRVINAGGLVSIVYRR